VPGDAHWEHYRDGRPEPPAELTDEQRELARTFIQENPNTGWKAAMKAAGIRCLTRAEAKKIVFDDQELRDEFLRPYGLDMSQLLLNMGRVAGDPENRGSVQANRWAFDVLHKMVEHKQVEHVGEVTQHHQVAVSVSHNWADLRRELEEARGRSLGAGDPRGALPAGPDPVLSARADAEAGGGVDDPPGRP
jgi:hypothetical protein